MTIWWFIIPALGLSAVAVALAALGLRRGALVNPTEGGRRDMRIYADQMGEIERDRARGVIADDEAERLRAETARRLLEADRRSVGALGRSPRGMQEIGRAHV